MINHLQGSRHRIRNQTSSKVARNDVRNSFETSDSDSYSAISGDENSNEKPSNNNNCSKKITRHLIELIAGTCQPISIVSNPFFRKFLASLNKKYVTPCAKKLSNELIPAEVKIIFYFF